MHKGIGASPGIAVGKARLMRRQALGFEAAHAGDADLEIGKLLDALSASTEDLKLLAEKTQKEIGAQEAQIFEAHQMMLNDPEYTAQIQEAIRGGSSAPQAVQLVTEQYMEIFLAIEDAYLRERAADLKDVSQRLIKKLLGVREADLDEAGIILVAEDLSPSDTARIDKNKVLGFVTEIGGPTSHSAIMARTIGIPAIVGAGDLLSKLEDGMALAMDGETGELFFDPSPACVAKLEEKAKALAQEAETLKGLIGAKTVSADGCEVELACNIGSVKDLAYVLENDGEGIGLFRSEFLYMDRDDLPTEEEQFKAYKAVLEGMGGKPVVIRTLDVGGDKALPYLNIPKEENPFLGFRAVRYCLKNEAVFKDQLKALLRAGVYGDLRIMMPMISGIDEVRQAKALIETCKAELRAAETAFSDSYQLGIMIEIPSAALIADLLAKEVDFFSIGTNDLIQYTVAVDRMNQDIADLYTPYHPAVLRLVKMVIDAGKQAGIWVGMCGEAAGNLQMIPLLLAMGLEEFSMSPSKILKARALIQRLNKAELSVHVDKVLSLPNPQAVADYLKQNLI